VRYVLGVVFDLCYVMKIDSCMHGLAWCIANYSNHFMVKSKIYIS